MSIVAKAVIISLQVALMFYYVSPLNTEVGKYCFTPVCSVCLSLYKDTIHFSPALSIVQAVKHETLTQC